MLNVRPKSATLEVALKTLIVIHRALREGDPTFREELLNFQQRGGVLQLATFKDGSSPIGYATFSVTGGKLAGWGLNSDEPNAASIEESNVLALAIVPTDATSNGSTGVQAKDLDLTGWELALVTAPTNDISSFQEGQLGGGLDSLTLNSLYDEGAYRAAQQPVYGSPAPNTFEVGDPFVAAAPTANPFGPYQPHENLMMGPPNPFVDSGFGPFPVSNTHTQTTNPFGPGLLL
ncbi:hypothetical protein L1987_62750 [Smallanthus sonchifolius]|uniref:Uncharacterized protein n=1 Tax=Smallanthus sonchifolius TaxID=185202 RepID=A0ACB9CBC7_9ASTR|nr:hypothetical protein L1987_62750 [Smallanthus sonchifolius]